MDLDRTDTPERIRMARRRGVRGHSDYVREEEVFWREVPRGSVRGGEAVPGVREAGEESADFRDVGRPRLRHEQRGETLGTQGNGERVVF